MKNFFPLQAWEDKKILMTSLPGRRKNLMKCNPAKCNYMILREAKESIALNWNLEIQYWKESKHQKILGIQISNNLSWTKKCPGNL